MKKIVTVFLFVSLLFTVATITPLSEKSFMAVQGTVKIAGGTALFLAGMAVTLKILNALIKDKDYELLELIPGYVNIHPLLVNTGSVIVLSCLTLVGSTYLMKSGFNDLPIKV